MSDERPRKNPSIVETEEYVKGLSFDEYILKCAADSIPCSIDEFMARWTAPDPQQEESRFNRKEEND